MAEETPSYLLLTTGGRIALAAGAGFLVLASSRTAGWVEQPPLTGAWQEAADPAGDWTEQAAPAGAWVEQ